ncbi:MAG TPA: histidine phosphatase family protein [Candidatus Methylomirabilis sp.]|nr:histidine phosphatase family protein [Candidatus Methylomirabilis sp.]
MSRSISVALVRHAATAWNAARRAQGQSDLPLSAEGEAQVARWRLPSDLVRLQATGGLGWAVSPLRRAVETARVLGALEPILEPRLMETDYGAWTGRSLEEVETLAGDPGWERRPPGGESPVEVLARVRAWLDEVADRGGPETWVAVTHAGVIRVLLAATLQWDMCSPAPLRLLPERLHRLRRRGDGHLQLLTLNESLTPP